LLPPVDVFPLGLRDLAAASAREKQEHDGVGGRSVFLLADSCDEALSLVARQETLSIHLWGGSEPGGRVRARAGDAPLLGKIEDVSQQHQHAICGPGSVTLRVHAVDQSRHVPAADRVDSQGAEAGQDVEAQDTLVFLPAPLRSFGVGQIALTDQFIERWDRSPFVTAGLRIGSEQRLGQRRPAQAPCLLKRQ